MFAAAAGSIDARAEGNRGAAPAVLHDQEGEMTGEWRENLRATRPTAFLFLLCLNLAGAISGGAKAAGDALPSWNDGPAKAAIVDFVTRVTTEGGPDFVPVADRIATFDNDGTLWSEQPLYFQLIFALDRVKTLAPQHPEWQSEEPFRSVLADDPKGALAGGEAGIAKLVMATHAGMTSDEFNTITTDWLATARHPKLQRPYTELVYQPMLEVLAYLRANGFKTYIVSGGGIEFVRTFSARVYGIPPEQVIGSSGKLKFELRDGKPVLLRLPEIDFIDDKEGKPVGIQKFIGRRPIAAFGNSDGDLQMLQWTTAGDGPRFGLIVHYTDADREWSYDRKSHIGMLDKALDEAEARGWTVVNMKDDWKTIFPPPK
jgi:haloacid dehalogenase-like hydrolase